MLATARPSGENQTSRDPGVLGLQSTRAQTHQEPKANQGVPTARDAVVEEGAATNRWGDEDPAFLAAKARRIDELRAESKRILSERFTWKHAAATMLGLYAYRRMANLAGVRVSTATVWLVVLSLARVLWVNRAPKRLNEDTYKQYTNWPIFGQIGAPLKGLSISFVELQKQESAAGGYRSYENIVFGANRDISIMNPEDREYVLKTNWKKFTKNNESNSSFDKVFPELMGRGIFAVDGDEWQDHRKIASHLFSANGLRAKMEASFVSHGKNLTDTLDDLINSSSDQTGVNLDWQEAMQAFTFETICDIAFGVDPAALQASLLRDEKIPFLVAFDQLQTESVMRLIAPFPITYFLRLFHLGYEKRIYENGVFVREYVTRIIRERLASSAVETKEDLLSMYIRTSRATGKPWIESVEYLSDAVLNFIVAGRDTTSYTLTHLFEVLSERPDVVEKMLSELDDVVGGAKDVTWDDVRELRYCNAVFNELLRLNPPVGFDFRIAREDDTLPSGLRVAKNTRVNFHNIAIGRDPNLWRRAEEFLPERWLDDEHPERPVRRVDEYVHPVFFGGPRLCLGKDMARLEVLNVAYAVLKRFKVTVLPNQDKRMTDGPVAFYVHGLKVRVTRR